MVTTGYSPEGRELVASGTHFQQRSTCMHYAMYASFYDNSVMSLLVLSARCGHTILYCGGFNCRTGCFADLFMLNAGMLCTYSAEI